MLSREKDKQQHPLNVLSCCVCNQTIGLTESYKLSEGKNFHPKCFESIIGLEKTEKKSFLMSKGELSIKVKLPKKVWRPGEEIVLHIAVDNQANKKVNSVHAHILQTETTMQVVDTPRGLERVVIKIQ
jgi:hypothetical protein